MSYILFTLSALGYQVNEISNMKGEKKVKNPLDKMEAIIGEAKFESTSIDKMLLPTDFSLIWMIVDLP